MPAHFEAVGEALASGSGSIEACEVAGSRLAQDGASLDDALEALNRTALAVTGSEPVFADVRALSMAWSESTLAYLHQLSCEDPMTGLASLAHIRSRLSELYRGAHSVDKTHALVVLDLPNDPVGGDSFTRAMRLVRLGEVARTVFAGSETIGRSGSQRVVVIAERDGRLGRRVALLRKLVSSEPTRLWIEGLPQTDEAAALLLDELCRR
ncbi:GGDEF domain-containing protein [Nocardioides daedukensis]|uniref:GGDEF domain-containing protein n=1 Tax=Nocardioides daedukensis TaxID=634462 RepID=A0A7Y9S3A6_9ACTN|nr:hypothetical protein [Nocardioides daedukensis]NYG60541.1 GGDEF domain-containing protein [Nocardioides daedukensis]